MASKSMTAKAQSIIEARDDSLPRRGFFKRLRLELEWAGLMPNHLLRAIGLALLGDYQRKGEEEPKLVLKHSISTALARCSIHIFPSTVSIILLVLNFGGCFIGTELAGHRDQDSIKIATLQSCAKIQELLILASVSTLLLHLTRLELLAGPGMSLGLITSSFSYSKLSYFWSPEFIGGLRGIRRAGWRRLFFITILCVAGLLALFAGPATAVLMIPRDQDWPAGGTVFWVNGTQQDFWPEHLQGGTMHPEACSQSGRVFEMDCATAGYLSIYNFFAATQRPHTSPFRFDVIDAKGQREARGWLRDTSVDQDTWAVVPHVTVGTIQDRIRSCWASAVYTVNVNSKGGIALGTQGYSRFMFADTRTSRVNVSNPHVRTACSKRTEVYWNSSMANSSEISVDFPILNSNVSWQSQRRSLGLAELHGGPTLGFGVAHLLKSIIDSDSSHSSVINIRHTALSEDFGNVSMGLLVARPMWDSSNQWAVMGCSVDARWAESSLSISDFKTGATWNSEWANSDSLLRVETSQDVPLHLTASNALSTQHMSSRLVRFDESYWSEMSPVLSGEFLPGARVNGLAGHKERHNFSTTEWLLSNMDLTTRLDVQLPTEAIRNVQLAPVFVEHILSTLIADAMARVNSRYTALDEMGGIPNPINSLGLVRSGKPIVAIQQPVNVTGRGLKQLVMEQTIRGYAFSIVNVSDILAATVLLVHILLATGHTLWILWPWRRGLGGSLNTSDAWDSVVDWVALSLVSPVPKAEALSNVGGGVRKSSTMTKQFWIEVEGEKLQLVVLDEGTGVPRQRSVQVEPDQKYS